MDDFCQPLFAALSAVAGSPTSPPLTAPTVGVAVCVPSWVAGKLLYKGLVLILGTPHFLFGSKGPITYRSRPRRLRVVRAPGSRIQDPGIEPQHGHNYLIVKPKVVVVF